MRKISILLMSLTMIFINSCMTQRVMLVKGARVNEESPTYSNSQPFFVNGIGQTQELNINEACKGRNPVAVDVQYTAIDALLHYITGSIYSPRTVKVYCQ